jgi:hypothetical protein
MRTATATAIVIGLLAGAALPASSSAVFAHGDSLANDVLAIYDEKHVVVR